VSVDQHGVPLRRYVEQVMGMPVSLALRGRHVDDEDARDAWHRCLGILRQVDAEFSAYRDDSFVSRVNRGELGVEDGSAEVQEVLDLAERARQESGGAFDVRRVAADGTTTLDTDGVVKGWAVQRAADPLTELTDTDFCLAAGGDIVCHVADDSRPAWRIGIENPQDPSTLVATVEVRRGGIATSGHAHRGRHVVDARTGRCPSAVASVTVLAEDLTWADLDATAAYALGPEALTWLRSRPGRRGLVVWDDGRSAVFGEEP
jgi:thiamine biosynthesis lipoprotein